MPSRKYAKEENLNMFDVGKVWGAPRKGKQRRSNPMHGNLCSRFKDFFELLSLKDKRKRKH